MNSFLISALSVAFFDNTIVILEASVNTGNFVYDVIWGESQRHYKF